MLLPLKDYQRIHKTIYSILRSENADITTSCMLFSMFGCEILIDHYKLEPQIVAGIAAYRIAKGEKGACMFADRVDNKLTSSENGFHCWIEVDGWLIDFMAPLFPDMLRSAGGECDREPKMMQKRLQDMAELPEPLVNIGDFYLERSNARTKALTEHFQSKQAYLDLAKITSTWFKRPPKRMFKETTNADAQGNIIPVTFQGHSLVGAW